MRGKEFNNNIINGKRTNTTPARLYRVPGGKAKAAPKQNKDSEAAYHGVRVGYRDNVRNTTRVEHYPKFSYGGDGMRDSAARQLEEQERRRNDPDHREGVSASELIPATWPVAPLGPTRRVIL